jgi:hypothetical protein
MWRWVENLRRVGLFGEGREVLYVQDLPISAFMQGLVQAVYVTS